MIIWQTKVTAALTVAWPVLVETSTNTARLSSLLLTLCLSSGKAAWHTSRQHDGRLDCRANSGELGCQAAGRQPSQLMCDLQSNWPALMYIRPCSTGPVQHGLMYRTVLHACPGVIPPHCSVIELLLCCCKPAGMLLVTWRRRAAAGRSMLLS